MANGLYAPFKERLLNKEVDLNSDTIKAMLVDNADYTVNLTTHTALADVAAGAREETATLASLTIALGVFDSADFTWTAASGDVCASIILYDDTHASKALIVYYDTGVTGMPVTLNGGDVNCTVHASGWFAL